VSPLGSLAAGSPLVRSGDLLVRRLRDDDAEALARWLSDDAVLEWYRGRDRRLDVAGVRATYLAGGDRILRCAVEWDGDLIGYVEVGELASEERASLGYRRDEPAVFRVDVFIGEADYRDHGVGTQVVEAVAWELLAHHGAERVVLDPDARNVRAMRCYEKAGFERVRPLPGHVRLEGEAHDAWLYERTA
jgi:aminoglycoside 6'-N-acetyltransferase